MFGLDFESSKFNNFEVLGGGAVDVEFYEGALGLPTVMAGSPGIDVEAI
jgi:hypothetical protein